MPHFIADEITAERIAGELQSKHCGPNTSTTVFSYRHRLGATLFGIELKHSDANGTQYSETILYQ